MYELLYLFKLPVGIKDINPNKYRTYTLLIFSCFTYFSILKQF